jgi:hypothetical protein
MRSKRSLVDTVCAVIKKLSRRKKEEGRRKKEEGRMLIQPTF